MHHLVPGGVQTKHISDELLNVTDWKHSQPNLISNTLENVSIIQKLIRGIAPNLNADGAPNSKAGNAVSTTPGDTQVPGFVLGF